MFTAAVSTFILGGLIALFLAYRLYLHVAATSTSPTGEVNLTRAALSEAIANFANETTARGVFFDGTPSSTRHARGMASMSVANTQQEAQSQLHPQTPSQGQVQEKHEDDSLPTHGLSPEEAADFQATLRGMQRFQIPLIVEQPATDTERGTSDAESEVMLTPAIRRLVERRRAAESASAQRINREWVRLA